jgi:large subunit ribosomal protein L35
MGGRLGGRGGRGNRAGLLAFTAGRRYGRPLRERETEEAARRHGLPWLLSFAAISGLRPGYQRGAEMPKLKTKSGVKKRFKITATGKVKHGVAGKRHRLISHNSKYIRQNRGTAVLSEAETPKILQWAPYGLK